MAELVSLVYDIREAEVRPHLYKGIVRAVAQSGKDIISGVCYDFVRLGIGFKSISSFGLYSGLRPDLILTMDVRNPSEVYGSFRKRCQSIYLIPLDELNFNDVQKICLNKF